MSSVYILLLLTVAVMCLGLYLARLPFVIGLCFGLYFSMRSNPVGTSWAGPVYLIRAADIRFRRDISFETTAGQVVRQQEIFDEIFAVIDRAERYILLDLFLFNGFMGQAESCYRPLCRELTDRLLARRKACPEIRIDFITDPINAAYGGSRLAEFDELKAAGVNMIYTNLNRMRDSNLVYSPLWRLLFWWTGNSEGGGFLKHPFSADMPRVNLRTYLSATNFKANHRKVILADDGDSWMAVVTSANPHDASSAHSNVALFIRDHFGAEIYRTEQSVAAFSGAELQACPPMDGQSPAFADPTVAVRLVTERLIRTELLEHLEGLGPGDKLMMAMFYLSDRPVISALLRAAARGAEIRIILDPSNDAFGRPKYGIPNQCAAYELVTRSQGRIGVRWYRVHGEQFHSKFVQIDLRSGDSFLLLGSANLTRRNIGGFNLETDVSVAGHGSVRVFDDVRGFFNRLWHNEGAVHTDEHAIFPAPSFAKRCWTIFFERSGWSTF